MRKSSVVMVIIGLLLLAIGFTVPAYVTGQVRKLPDDLDVTVTSSSPQGLVRIEHITTAPTEEIDEIAVHATQEFILGGDVLFDIEDDVTLIGHSRFPVLDSSAHLAGGPTAVDDDTRDGLQYFFSANLERRSYPYFDIFLGQSVPVDYVDREDDTYEFQQSIPETQLPDGATYSVERNVLVDRHSGIILNRTEDITYALDDLQFNAELSFDEDTRAAAEELAADAQTALTTARILDFLTKFSGLVLIAIGLIRR